MDESGTDAVPGNTSHFVLAGVCIPVWRWRVCDRELAAVKDQFLLPDAEIHTAWIRRRYLSQSRIPDFDDLPHPERRALVKEWRARELLRLQRRRNRKHYRRTKKFFKKTDSYIHLSQDEREKFLVEVGRCIGGWGFARLFAECIDKAHLQSLAVGNPRADEQAFEQVVSRYEQYLETTYERPPKNHGLLVYDNNEAVNRKFTTLMGSFHKAGTLWTKVDHIVETPLFVDSELTCMVQVADFCAYAFRRYVENGEDTLLNLVFQRAHRRNNKAVGVRHYAAKTCTCKICSSH